VGQVAHATDLRRALKMLPFQAVVIRSRFTVRASIAKFGTSCNDANSF
jgi:hypothetical protein